MVRRFSGDKEHAPDPTRAPILGLCLGLCLSVVFHPIAHAEKPRSKVDEIPFDPLWTPPPATGSAPAWQKMTDKDWIDPRLRSMNTGRTWNATFRASQNGLVGTVYRGTAVLLGNNGEGAMLFDRNQLRWVCGWETKGGPGGPSPGTNDCFVSYLEHSDRRFGLLNTPTPKGELQWSSESMCGAWMSEAGLVPPQPATAPLRKEFGRYRGMFRHENRTVMQYTVGQGANEVQIDDAPWIEIRAGQTVFSRSLNLSPGPAIDLLIGSHDPADPAPLLQGRMVTATTIAAAWRASRPIKLLWKTDESRVILHVPASTTPRQFDVQIWQATPNDGKKLLLDQDGPNLSRSLDELLRPASRVWTETLHTVGNRAVDDGPYVIDTLTIPYDNPHKALFFASGVDFLPTARADADIALSTAHGDVWLVGGANADLKDVTWQRFATGLYQPLGLKIVQGKIYVLERGQLTVLHDLNGDGEADFYECFADDWHIGGGEHSFHTCLEVDHDGNFYFYATGDAEVPTGGTLLRVSPTGKKTEVFATGFRHPVGLGVIAESDLLRLAGEPVGRTSANSTDKDVPRTLITGADQQGNWMPSTRLDVFHPGGFYGDMRTHHRLVPPQIYDAPLCWIPHHVDTSAGGEVFVNRDDFGPLSRKFLHFSYGKCTAMMVLPQRVSEVWQGGVIDLGWLFLAGIQRGGFRPSDGALYMAGMNGWQTAATKDGCLQRVRWTGQPLRLPETLRLHQDHIELTFNQPLDPATANDSRRWHVEQWNYLWTEKYGSDRWKVSDPKQIGQDEIPVKRVTLQPNGKTVIVQLASTSTKPVLQPVMQMQIEYRLKNADGEPYDGVIYNTINK